MSKKVLGHSHQQFLPRIDTKAMTSKKRRKNRPEYDVDNIAFAQKVFFSDTEVGR